MTQPIKVIARQPIGEREVSGFRSYTDGSCRAETWVEPAFAPSPHGRELRDLRVSLGLSLGEAARKLGIRPAEMSGLENGRHEPDGGGWNYLHAMLRGVR